MMFAFRAVLLITLFIPLLANADEPVNRNDIQTKKTMLSKTSRISPQPLLDVVEGQLKLLRTLEIEKAYNEYTTKEFRNKTSLDDFKKLIAKYKVLANNNLFQFQSFYIEDDIASLGGELHSKDGVTVPVEFDFILEDGQWKIMGIQIYQNELPLPAKGDG
jgi:hypothetical protein